MQKASGPLASPPPHTHTHLVVHAHELLQCGHEGVVGGRPREREVEHWEGGRGYPGRSTTGLRRGHAQDERHRHRSTRSAQHARAAFPRVYELRSYRHRARRPVHAWLREAEERRRIGRCRQPLGQRQDRIRVTRCPAYPRIPRRARPPVAWRHRWDSRSSGSASVREELEEASAGDSEPRRRGLVKARPGVQVGWDLAAGEARHGHRRKAEGEAVRHERHVGKIGARDSPGHLGAVRAQRQGPLLCRKTAEGYILYNYGRRI